MNKGQKLHHRTEIVLLFNVAVDGELPQQRTRELDCTSGNLSQSFFE